MINAMKSIVNSFKAWARPKNRRPVLVPLVPVQKPDDTAAVDKARRELLATLGAVLDKKRTDFDAAIEDADRALFDFMRNGLRAECLLETLHKLNFHKADDFDDDELSAFAAAVDYYCQHEELPFMDAMTLAAGTIESDEYTHYPDVDTYEKLGRKVIEWWWDGLPDELDEYFNYEQFGEDYANDHEGEFTVYGFFTPKEDY